MTKGFVSDPNKRINVKRLAETLMGKTVLVDKIVKRSSHYDGTSRNIKVVYAEQKITPRTGWLTGVRWYRGGDVKDYYGDGREWHPSGKAIPHYLVVFWPTQNPVKVPFDGLVPWNEGDPEPWDGTWDAEERRSMSLCAIDYERDEKGRFI